MPKHISSEKMPRQENGNKFLKKVRRFFSPNFQDDEEAQDQIQWPGLPSFRSNQIAQSFDHYAVPGPEYSQRGYGPESQGSTPATTPRIEQRSDFSVPLTRGYGSESQGLAPETTPRIIQAPEFASPAVRGYGLGIQALTPESTPRTEQAPNFPASFARGYVPGSQGTNSTTNLRFPQAPINYTVPTALPPARSHYYRSNNLDNTPRSNGNAYTNPILNTRPSVSFAPESSYNAYNNSIPNINSSSNGESRTYTFLPPPNLPNRISTSQSVPSLTAVPKKPQKFASRLNLSGPSTQPVPSPTIPPNFDLTPLSSLISQSYSDIKRLRAINLRQQRNATSISSNDLSTVDFDKLEERLKQFEESYKIFLKYGGKYGEPAEEVCFVAMVMKKGDVKKGNFGATASGVNGTGSAVPRKKVADCEM